MFLYFTPLFFILLKKTRFPPKNIRILYGIRMMGWEVDERNGREGGLATLRKTQQARRVKWNTLATYDWWTVLRGGGADQ